MNLSEFRMDRTEGLVQRRRQPKVEENHDVNDDDRDEEEERVSYRCQKKNESDLNCSTRKKFSSSFALFYAPRCYFLRSFCIPLFDDKMFLLLLIFV